MKTLFIIYIVLSVLVVLFCLLVVKALRKQNANISKINANNVAEIKSRMEEVNALTNALAEKEKTIKECECRITEYHNTMLKLDNDITDANIRLEFANATVEDADNAIKNLRDIIHLLAFRHDYTQLEGYNKDANIAEMVEFFNNNCTRVVKRKKRSKVED